MKKEWHLIYLLAAQKGYWASPSFTSPCYIAAESSVDPASSVDEHPLHAPPMTADKQLT